MSKVPNSPTLVSPLEGYAQQVSVAPGEVQDFKISGAEKAIANVELLRLVHGDPRAGGPGYKVEHCDWFKSDGIVLTEQHLPLGSLIEVDGSIDLTEGFTLAVWFFPTLLNRGWQTLAAIGEPGNFSFGLYLAGDSMLTAALSGSGNRAEWCTAHEFVSAEEWHFAAVSYDPKTNQLAVHQALSRSIENAPSNFGGLTTTEVDVPFSTIHTSSDPLTFAGSKSGNRHWGHFNGKLSDPVLYRGALTIEQVKQLADGFNPGRIPNLISHWKFDQQVGTTLAVDGVSNRHGRVINAPARAVTGPKWSGPWSGGLAGVPHEYNAIHFHEDDLDDANWKTTLSVELPDTKPGIYAARVWNDVDELFLPFVVRPKRARVDVCVLVPTLTWQAYSSNRDPARFTDDGALDRALCLYDAHSDGSRVFYSSHRKPHRTGNPKKAIQNWGAHTMVADLYLTDWLEHINISYDLYSDHDLAASNGDLLPAYKVLIIAGHPEYWTCSMRDQLDQYLAQGGRCLYVGGNGLYWVTSIDKMRPHLMEVRKSSAGLYPPFKAEKGNEHHSTTGEFGGTWLERGRSTAGVTGLEYAANLFAAVKDPKGFVRRPESYSTKFAPFFDGIADESIGNFGLNLGTAAAFEMDAVRLQRPGLTILAEASEPGSFSYSPLPPLSHISYMEHPKGGGMFAAGAVTWAGSLSHNNYQNSVSQLTENALKHFLSVPKGEVVIPNSS
ncbi:N,N-dimethylformamidase beta subunit family domain-containing protein [Mesorhizobium sp. M1406]|uniref:N,N-dimethylformamidase beta subunit family domain-containing protein n=1 Tax=Mesorhizobium sp. M1406 TaxID=2957099 RepID=UPI0033361D3F